MLGVGFFLAVSSLMQGSEKDFIRRLVDNSPHFTIVDQYRLPQPQAVQIAYPSAEVEIRHLTPMAETRGIRAYAAMLSDLREDSSLLLAPTLVGQGLVSFAGKTLGMTINGIYPDEFNAVSTLSQYFIYGSLGSMTANPDGIVVGEGLAKNLGINGGSSISVLVGSSLQAKPKTFKVVGIFRTGRSSFDESQTFMHLNRAQSLLSRPYRVNQILAKITDPNQARDRAQTIESRFGYKTISWQETSEDLLKTLVIRNIILYAVVSAVLVVAAFGIYNVISTVVIEKSRDIAILKSIGFHARDIEMIFLGEGLVLGVLGMIGGLPFGSLLIIMLSNVAIKYPGTSEEGFIPMDWSMGQFVLAGSFALVASTIAALLPAKKAARVNPVDILRGIT